MPTLTQPPTSTPAGGKAGGKPAGGGPMPIASPGGPFAGGPLPKPPMGPLQKPPMGGIANAKPGLIGGKPGGGQFGMPALPQPQPTLADTARRLPQGPPISGMQPQQTTQPKQATNKPVGS